ncbi:MAG: DUF4384 domain-containing protein [Blastocatellia bacterium]
MRFRSFNSCLIAGAVAGLVFPCFLVSRVEAQKGGAPAWYSVQTVNRVKKPDREKAATGPTGKGPVTQRAALLTVQWHLIERGTGNTQLEADSTKEFQTGDQVKLAITANQSGYLYIINQPKGRDGVVIFPDVRINKGRNYVLKDKEYVVPSFCPSFEDPKDCWFEMKPPAGTETLIVIFSREKITTLPNQVDEAYGVVNRKTVEQLIASSEQKVEQKTGKLTIPGKKSVRYATRVQNTNRKDNEELIATIDLTHGE